MIENCDEDFDDEQEDDNSIPDYYLCMCCGTDRAKKPPYNECPNCGATMEEQFY